MVQYLKLKDLSTDRLDTLLRRAEADISDLFVLAQQIIDKVKAEGDSALVHYTRALDAPEYDVTMLRATKADFAAARQ